MENFPFLFSQGNNFTSITLKIFTQPPRPNLKCLFFVPFVYLDLIKCLWILTSFFLFSHIFFSFSRVCFLNENNFHNLWIRHWKMWTKEGRICLVIGNFMLWKFLNWYALHTAQKFCCFLIAANKKAKGIMEKGLAVC